MTVVGEMSSAIEKMSAVVAFTKLCGFPYGRNFQTLAPLTLKKEKIGSFVFFLSEF